MDKKVCYYEYEFWDTTNNCSILEFRATDHIVDWRKFPFTGYDFVSVSPRTMICAPDTFRYLISLKRSNNIFYTSKKECGLKPSGGIDEGDK